MKAGDRIILNTGILYAKIIVCMVLSLWTVPVTLRALGVSDYGLYNLVAGVVVMLAFLNSSMTVASQRYMSVTMGMKDAGKLNAVYNASIRIHLCLAVFIAVFMEVCALFLFNGFLNIRPERIAAAKWIYQFMVVSTFFSILAVPYDAALNAYENMLAISLIFVAEAFGKLLLAFSLFYVAWDKLLFYGIGMAAIYIAATFVKWGIVRSRYRAIRIDFHAPVERSLFQEMVSYAGWSAFGSVAMMGKNQGIAIILNLFKGTAINAAYGVANQINGLLSSFTSSIQKAIAPQLMQKEGANQRDASLAMSFSLVKVATLVFGLMAIPAIIEMRSLLALWLGDNIPEYSVPFCRLILLCQLLFQFSSGVALSIDAGGKIKAYRLALSCVLILNLPVAYMLMRAGFQPYAVLFSTLVFEAICLHVRLGFAHKLVGYSIVRYFRTCAIPLTVTLLSAFMVGRVIMSVFVGSPFLRMGCVGFATSVTAMCGGYFLVFSRQEQHRVRRFLRDVFNHTKPMV